MAPGRVGKPLERGDFVAEFFVNKQVTPHIYRYVITRKNSREIVMWGDGITLEVVRNDASSWIDMNPTKSFKVS